MSLKFKDTNGEKTVVTEEHLENTYVNKNGDEKKELDNLLTSIGNIKKDFDIDWKPVLNDSGSIVPEFTLIIDGDRYVVEV